MITDVSHVTSETNKKSPDEALQFVEAGMNLAGNAITDPHLKELLRQYVYGEISAEECKAAGMRHILSHT